MMRRKKEGILIGWGADVWTPQRPSTSSERVRFEAVCRGGVRTRQRMILLTALCLLWFQIQDISVETEDNKERRSAKDALLLWCQMKTAGWGSPPLRLNCGRRR